MIHVSDGLIGDLRHVAEASGLAIDLDTEALSVDRELLVGAAEAVGVDPWTWVFGGGDDEASAAAFAGRVSAGWRAIGRLPDGPATCSSTVHHGPGTRGGSRSAPIYDAGRRYTVVGQ